MVLIHQRQTSRKSRSLRCVLIIICSILLCLCFMNYTIIKTLRSEMKEKSSAKNHFGNHLPETYKYILSHTGERLDDDATRLFTFTNEKRFQNTLKSCLPDNQEHKKCLMYVPTRETHDSNNEIQRIAFLSLPGYTVENFTQWLRKIILKIYDDDEELLNQNIDLFHTSHVPPYGYGKTHGWTKIIRFIHLPILNEVIDTILRLAEYTFYHDLDNIENFEKQMEHSINDTLKLTTISDILRQSIRWHCRLSHVAAHTSLLNFDLSILSQPITNEIKDFNKPSVESSLIELIEYIIMKVPTKDGNHDDEREKMRQKITQVLHENPYVKVPTWTSSKRIRTYIKETLNHLESILLDELERSNDLSKWPCLSFWDVSSHDSKPADNTNNISKTLASLLSPDCAAAFTQCSVNRDKCEYRGDATCK